MMDRYSPYTSSQGWKGEAFMEKDAEGDWVPYEAAQKRIAGLEVALVRTEDELENATNEVRSALSRLSERIAELEAKSHNDDLTITELGIQIEEKDKRIAELKESIFWTFAVATRVGADPINPINPIKQKEAK